MSVSANRVWRQLPMEIRVAACSVFWVGAQSAQKQYLYVALARAKNVREVFVRKSTTERLVNWTAATLTLPDQIVEDVVKQYLLKDHRGVIIRFLEHLEIPHSEGMIEESFDMSTLTNERVQAAARTLLGEADGAGAELYLKYLVLQGAPWEGIEEVLPSAE